MQIGWEGGDQQWEGVREGKGVELDHNTLYTCVKSLKKKLKFGATKML